MLEYMQKREMTAVSQATIAQNKELMVKLRKD